MKFLRDPLVHFFLAGAAIYLLYGLFAEDRPVEIDKTIVVSAGEIQWMQSSWKKRWNRSPTEEEFDTLIENHIKETVLYREALTMGLNKHDMVIRRRLAQKLEFLAKDLVTLTQPTEDELQHYFSEHIQRYTQPVRYTFTQIFIDPDKHGESTFQHSEKIKQKLQSLESNHDIAEALGDDLMLQKHYSHKRDELEIQKQFGKGFTESLLKLSPGQWHGPILSGYGVHLVYMNDIIKSPLPLFSESREKVIINWTEDKSEEINKQFYTNLKAQYTIVIEDEKESIQSVQKQ